MKSTSYTECRFALLRPDARDEVAKRIDKIVVEKQLYLDPTMSLPRLASIIGSNRTYLSNVLATRRGYRYYINSFRITHLYKLLREFIDKHNARAEEEELLAEPGEIVSSKELSVMIMSSGFSDMRTFTNAVIVSESPIAQKIREELKLFSYLAGKIQIDK